ncbi:segregation and condensation protein B [Listeria grandensis FSL F6-0971]|nr:segregation and condensation protein B [Listeria grandensis FSL F6-0971]
MDKGRVEGAGRAKLYVTTSEFLDCFGLNKLEDLPSMDTVDSEEMIQDEMDLFFDRFAGK